MVAFRDVVDECGLVDLGYVGHKITWRGKRQGRLVLERLDRAFATASWLSLNPATQVNHVRANSSDHNPILIKPEGIPPSKIKPFRFEQMWMKEQGCGDSIKSVWGASENLASMSLVLEKLKRCADYLTEWSKQTFGCI